MLTFIAIALRVLLVAPVDTVKSVTLCLERYAGLWVGEKAIVLLILCK